MGKTANRERWRAELHDYRADALSSAGLAVDGHDINADLCRHHADLCDELDALRDAYLDGGDSAAFKAKAAEVHELRRLWRSYGEAAGTRTQLTAVDGLSEPTDEELTK